MLKNIAMKDKTGKDKTGTIEAAELLKKGKKK